MIGIDEVGRGAWAGPLLVVAARQISDPSFSLTDSKLLSARQRQNIFKNLPSYYIFGEGWVEPNIVDQLGLTESMKLAVNEALGAIGARVDELIIMDGNINYCNSKYNNVECVIKADRDYSAVSAASIYAKIKRDRRMADLSKQLPGYGFEKHVGYGTKQHLAALEQYGVTVQHRLSFKPIRAIL